MTIVLAVSRWSSGALALVWPEGSVSVWRTRRRIPLIPSRRGRAWHPYQGVQMRKLTWVEDLSQTLNTCTDIDGVFTQEGDLGGKRSRVFGSRVYPGISTDRHMQSRREVEQVCSGMRERSCRL